MALSMINYDMILKSCKVMMTCVYAISEFYKAAWYSELSSRTVNDTGTANSHHGLSMTGTNKWNRSAFVW